VTAAQQKQHLTRATTTAAARTTKCHNKYNSKNNTQTTTKITVGKNECSQIEWRLYIEFVIRVLRYEQVIFSFPVSMSGARESQRRNDISMNETVF